MDVADAGTRLPSPIAKEQEYIEMLRTLSGGPLSKFVYDNSKRTSFSEVTGNSIDALLVSPEQSTNIYLAWNVEDIAEIAKIRMSTPKGTYVVVWRTTGSPQASEPDYSLRFYGRLSDPNYNVVVSRVRDLRQEDAEDPDSPKPSGYAYNRALFLLNRAARLMKNRFPRASAGVDDEGGIRLYWRSPKANVHLAVPGYEGRRSFIYHSQGDKYGTERPVTPESLATWLDWFSGV